jgi:hypothetical protein
MSPVDLSGSPPSPAWFEQALGTPARVGATEVDGVDIALRS